MTHLPDPIARRRGCVQTARSWLDEHPVFLDTETTGTDDYAEVCEIAVIGPDGETIVDELVKPSRPIPQSATEVHGISDADVEDAPTMRDLEPELEEILLMGTPCCIYNADFDTRLLRQSATSGPLLDWPVHPSRVHCVMELMAWWHADWSDVHQSYTRISQGDAAIELGIDVDAIDDLHRARADAELCRRILHALASMTQEGARWLEDHDCPETEELEVLTMPGSPESKIRTIKVCPECKPLLDTPDATPDDLDRFRLRDT